MPIESENLETIKKFKTLFTEEEAKKFLTLEADLLIALKEYNASTDDDAAFRSDNKERQYTRDVASEINLTTLSVIIVQLSQNNTANLISNLLPFYEAVEELKKDIAVFKKHDPDESRKKTYQEALDYFNKISHSLSPPQNEASPTFKMR